MDNNSKIVLVTCPLCSPNNIPLALPCLSAYLKEEGYDVVCFDFSAILYNDLSDGLKSIFNNIEIWEGLDANIEVDNVIKSYINFWAETILITAPLLIGFSTTIVNIRCSLLLASEIKKIKPDAITVFGGPESTVDYLKIIDDLAVDYVIAGEGEKPLVELASIIRNSSNIHNNSVINKGFQRAPELACNEDLNILPYPDFNALDLSLYGNHSDLEFPLYTSTGCTRNCTFCSRGIFNNYFHSKSPKRIVEEIEHFLRTYNVSKYYFVDSLINGNIHQVLEEWLSAIIAKKLNITWRANAIITPQMSFDVLQKMYHAGCRRLNIGIESGAEGVLKSMRKYSNVAVTEQVVQNAYQAGIFVTSFIIVGYPTETEDDFKLTLEFIKRNKKYIGAIQPGICYLIPGTELEKNKYKYGIIGEGNDWENKINNSRIRNSRLYELRFS